MSGKKHLPMTRIFTRLLLAGAVMFPVLQAGQAAGDTRVRVKIVTPNARIQVVKGHRYARTYPHESYREYPAHRHHAPGYVVVREHVHVYRVVPGWRYGERAPHYRHHHSRYQPYVQVREYERRGSHVYGRDRGRDYGRGECDSRNRDRVSEGDRWDGDYDE